MRAASYALPLLASVAVAWAQPSFWGLGLVASSLLLVGLAAAAVPLIVTVVLTKSLLDYINHSLRCRCGGTGRLLALRGAVRAQQGRPD